MVCHLIITNHIIGSRLVLQIVATKNLVAVVSLLYGRGQRSLEISPLYRPCPIRGVRYRHDSIGQRCQVPKGQAQAPRRPWAH